MAVRGLHFGLACYAEMSGTQLSWCPNKVIIADKVQVNEKS